VADPEIRRIDGGSKVATFAIAVNRKRGEETYTSYFDVAVWGDMAENVVKSLHRGDRIVVTGDLKQRSYEDKNGNKRSAVELQVEGIGHDLRWATSTVSKTE
jgi:single-strand DNA-binding protein